METGQGGQELKAEYDTGHDNIPTMAGKIIFLIVGFISILIFYFKLFQHSE